MSEEKGCSSMLWGAAQAISLGVHSTSEAFPEAMLLMEVLPSLLAARDFPRLTTLRMLQPGYRDSPDPSAVAIVFLMVRCTARCSLSWRPYESTDLQVDQVQGRGEDPSNVGQVSGIVFHGGRHW